MSVSVSKLSVYSAPEGSVKKKLKKAPRESRLEQQRTEPITYYELLELERQQNELNTVKIKIKRNFPIAPDGFIPNSVVQKFFSLLESNEPEVRTVWKLKWKAPDSEVIIEENSEAGRDSQNEKTMLDWESEDENAEENVEVAEEAGEDPEKILDEIYARLLDYTWFKILPEVNVENVIKYLVNRLIERDPTNHTIISEVIKEINEKLKMDPELLSWLITQLEEELDATENKIIANNIGLIASFKVETYNIDAGLINIITLAKDLRDEIRQEASKVLFSLTGITDENFDFIQTNIKKFQAIKNKPEKLPDFKLVKFVEEVEIEIAEAIKAKNEYLEKNSENFKAILKEDFIPTTIKETLKTLKDFLEYLLKYLKNSKSKILYEKVANHVFGIYNEFKLENTDWEKLIVEHFITNNLDVKAPEPLRILDLDNLNKYNQLVKNAKVKQQILMELLRSATHEKRPQVMQTALEFLKTAHTYRDEEECEQVLKFYRTKNFAKVTILTWQEVLDYVKKKPNVTIEEILEAKGLPPTHLDEPSGDSGGDDKKGKKGKNKKGKKEKEKGGKEKTKTKAEEEEAKPVGAIESISQEKKTSVKKSSKASLLPNNSESWKYYQERNDKEKEKTNAEETEGADGVDFIQKQQSQFIEMDDFDEEKNRSSLSKDILDGITKRVVFNENSMTKDGLKSEYSNDKISSFLHSNNEKCHLIDPSELSSAGHNFKFFNFKQNRRFREEEYNQLLKCLVIRGLNLHKHYERLLPNSLYRSTNETFVPIPFFNDFLVVHPYNIKNSGTKQISYQDAKKALYTSFMPPNMQPDTIEPIKSADCYTNSANAYPIRRATRTNSWRSSNYNEAKMNDFDLNHIFLLNKLLISYGAQNLRQFYSSINNDLKNYLHKLHTRIPHRIIPLIWNDPVIQKIALIISSTKQLQSKLNDKDSTTTTFFELKPKPIAKTVVSNGTNLIRSRTLDFLDGNLAFNARVPVVADEETEPKKFPSIRNIKGLNIGMTSIPKDQYGYWPIFRQEDTPRSRVTKKKLYSHLLNVKHEYIKLQWRYMLQDEKQRRQATTSYLPPLSLKATLYQPESANQS